MAYGFNQRPDKSRRQSAAMALMAVGVACASWLMLPHMFFVAHAQSGGSGAAVPLSQLNELGFSAVPLAGAVLSRGEMMGRDSVQALVEKLESGEIGAGTSDLELLRAVNGAKPITDLSRRKENGDRFGFGVYYHDYEGVILISKNGILFSAQYFEGKRRSYEKWFFCDTALLNEYIELSMAQDSPD